jgi:hypothetical protein
MLVKFILLFSSPSGFWMKVGEEDKPLDEPHQPIRKEISYQPTSI